MVYQPPVPRDTIQNVHRDEYGALPVLMLGHPHYPGFSFFQVPSFLFNFRLVTVIQIDLYQTWPDHEVEEGVKRGRGHRKCQRRR